MSFAQLDLSNRPTCRVNLPENYRRSAPRASRHPARRQIAASPYLNSGPDGIEVGLEHRFVSIHGSAQGTFALAVQGSRQQFEPKGKTL